MIALSLLLIAQTSGSVVIEAGASLDREAPLVERTRSACREIDAMLGPPPSPASRHTVTVERAPSIEAFVERTRRARFEAAALVGRTMWIQPVLEQLGDVDAVLRHECVHAILRARGVPPLEVIEEEAVALTLSGQAARLPPAPALERADRAELSRTLRAPRSRDAFERALARVVATYAARVTALARAGQLVDTLRRHRSLDDTSRPEVR